MYNAVVRFFEIKQPHTEENETRSPNLYGWENVGRITTLRWPNILPYRAPFPPSFDDFCLVSHD